MDRETTPNAPLHKFTDGRLSATVWANKGETGTYHTVTLSKLYEDKDGKLQDTHSFTGSELLRIAELAREVRVPADGGRRFQRNVGARSRRSWARIPDDAGHGFQLIVGARMMGALRPTV